MDLAEVMDEARQIAEELEGKAFRDPAGHDDFIARLARCVEALAKRVDVHDGSLYDERG
jgi:hypothetical protein